MNRDPSHEAASRPRPVRAVTTSSGDMLAGAVRRRTSSPQPPAETSTTSDARPPAKRARKAINCEPCRASKLKCDRARPCSSCVLRGTTTLCYQDAQPGEMPDSSVRAAPRAPSASSARIDPAQEFAKVRRSLALLETFVLQNAGSPSVTRSTPADHDYFSLPPIGSSVPPPDDRPPKRESVEPVDLHAPGHLGRQSGGLYAGPTNPSTHLLSGDPRESDEHSDHPPSEPEMLGEYDRDLLDLLPNLQVIDSLLAYYFDYCNWLWRYVNHASFTKAWTRYKTGNSTDRLAFAMACVIIAIATFYLSEDHPLRNSLPPPDNDDEEQGDIFYNVAMQVFARHQKENTKYSIDLIEFHLLRCHHMTLSKRDTEGVWAAKGEMVTIATAMGLHRDPGKWKMSRESAERRRWAWWHILFLERFQAMLFGRPLAIATRHFDTQLPSYCDPAVDPTGRLYLPNIATFRLAYILGDIMEDAVSLRPVPYSNVEAQEERLQQWLEALPPELDQDEYKVSRSIASKDQQTQRLGVQSIITRAMFNFVRFTLHRPHAAKAPSTGVSAKRNAQEARDAAQSLEAAVSAADRLIGLWCQSHADFLAEAWRALPGHLNWAALHLFSAAMFFSFQLISNPDQPGATLFRANVSRVMDTLRRTLTVMPVANKSYNILQALQPLYSDDYRKLSAAEREKKKQSVLGRVKSLAFPYHDASGGPRNPTAGYGSSGSQGSRNVDSPANTDSPLSAANVALHNAGVGVAPSPTAGPITYGPQPQENGNYALVAAQHSPSGPSAVQPAHAHATHFVLPGAHPMSAISPHTQAHLGAHVSYGSSRGHAHPGTIAMPPPGFYTDPTGYPITPGATAGVLAPQLGVHSDVHWGAAFGIDQTEWAHFLEPDNLARSL